MKTMTKKARLLDPKFRYYSAADTDVARTFRRIRREMAEAKKNPPANVKPIKKARTA